MEDLEGMQLIFPRMILYFPVSALVTLFGNILQNPLDPRARSDTRLMNLVVTFLSMLGQEAETGGVHRMLGVCSEFERIAKVVIDRVEKENSGRRKRKTHEGGSSAKPTAPASSQPQRSSTPSTAAPSSQTPRPSTASTPKPPQNHGTPSTTVNGQLSPPLPRESSQAAYTPMGSRMSQTPSPGMTPSNWPSDYNPAPADGSDFPSFADLTGFGAVPTGMGSVQSPPMHNGGMFSQPMLPQDLFSLPMTLDWDWAEMSGGAYPTVENGNFNDGQGGPR